MVFWLAASGMSHVTAADAERQAIRGGIVYRTYCTLCHGETADGMARAAPLYRDVNLAIEPAQWADYEAIIRLGGEAVGRSKYMPPWQDELSAEQLSDVIAYLKVVRDTEARGQVVFKTNCILCHGESADGQGRAAILHNPRPSNLRASVKDRDYLVNIITTGGAGVGRSATMPPWGLQLGAQEISDVATYLLTLRRPAAVDPVATETLSK